MELIKPFYQIEARRFKKSIDEITKTIFATRIEISKQDYQLQSKKSLEDARGILLGELNRRGWDYHNGELTKIA